MTQRWRLINGEELYDMDNDHGQRHNVAEQHPDVVAELRQHYEDWWAIVSERFGEDVPIIVGSESEPVSVITTHDWHNENSDSAWNQGAIRRGVECNGRWAIDVAESGNYTFELRRWPAKKTAPSPKASPATHALLRRQCNSRQHRPHQSRREEQSQSIVSKTKASPLPAPSRPVKRASKPNSPMEWYLAGSVLRICGKSGIKRGAGDWLRGRLTSYVFV